MKFGFTESMQYREKCFRNGNKLDKWRTYLVKSTGRNHYNNRYERKQFPCSLKCLKISCKCSGWSSRKVNSAVFRHWDIFQSLMKVHRITTFWLKGTFSLRPKPFFLVQKSHFQRDACLDLNHDWLPLQTNSPPDEHGFLLKKHNSPLTWNHTENP